MNTKISDVYSTNEYEKFKMIEGNRECTSIRAKKIGKSIKENGYILNPIVVNENYEIIDGVGRYTALMELNMPIVYVVQPGAGVKECAALNASTTKWTKMDYIRSYATLKNESYINLLNVINRFNMIPTDIVISTCYGVYTKLSN